MMPNVLIIKEKGMIRVPLVNKVVGESYKIKRVTPLHVLKNQNS